MTPPSLRVLLATAELHPTHRPDVAVLFGRMLPALGVQVDLLALTRGTPADPSDAAGKHLNAEGASSWTAGRAHLRRVRGHVPALVFDFLQQWQLFVLCRQQCDLLIVRDKPVLGVIGWLAARSAGVPFCYWMSYPLPEHYLWLAARRDAPLSRLRRLWLRCRGTLGKQMLSRVLVPRADWLFVQSQVMLDGLRAGTLQHDRVSAVPMGVDLTHLPEPAALLPEGLRGGLPVASGPASHPAPWAVYLGTLDRARGLEMLIDATLAVSRRRPDFRLLVIGEADEPADVGALRAAAERAGRLGDGFFPGKGDMAGLTELFDVVRQTAADAGRDASSIEFTAGHPGIFGDDPIAAVEEMASIGVGRIILPAFTMFKPTPTEAMEAFAERVIRRVA